MEKVATTGATTTGDCALTQGNNRESDVMGREEGGDAKMAQLYSSTRRMSVYSCFLWHVYVHVHARWQVKLPPDEEAAEPSKTLIRDNQSPCTSPQPLQDAE